MGQTLLYESGRKSMLRHQGGQKKIDLY